MKDIKKGDTLYAIRTLFLNDEHYHIEKGLRLTFDRIAGACWRFHDEQGLPYFIHPTNVQRYFSTTPPVSKEESKGEEDPLSDFTIPEFSDGDYHRLYDKLGHNYFGNPSDDRLRESGSTLGEIYRLRIDSVKRELNRSKTGIAIYMLLCELRENKPRPRV